MLDSVVNFLIIMFQAGLAQPIKLLLRRIKKPATASNFAAVPVSGGVGDAIGTLSRRNSAANLSISGGPSLKRQLTRSNSVFDAGSTMPFNYLDFLPYADEDGNYCYGRAVQSGIVRFGRSSVLKDVNINDIRDSSEGFATLLHTAASHGHEDIVSLLLENGADPMIKDSLNFTPLHRVMRLGKVGYPVMDVLLSHSPHLAGCEDRFGRTARDIAEEKSTKFDSVELGMIEALRVSEQCYLSKKELESRKQKQMISVSKSNYI